MKKTVILEDLDCAHCAGKIEEAVNELKDVEKCSVNFLTQKMIIDADEAAMDGILKEAKKIVKKIEPDVSHPIYIRNVFGLGYTFGETEC